MLSYIWDRQKDGCTIAWKILKTIYQFCLLMYLFMLSLILKIMPGSDVKIAVWSVKLNVW